MPCSLKGGGGGVPGSLLLDILPSDAIPIRPCLRKQRVAGDRKTGCPGARVTG